MFANFLNSQSITNKEWQQTKTNKLQSQTQWQIQNNDEQSKAVKRPSMECDFV